MSVYLRKKDRIYSQKSTSDRIISMYFLKNLGISVKSKILIDNFKLHVGGFCFVPLRTRTQALVRFPGN